MTREEAITVLKALYDNPLFSEVHKVAFNIAIHDIKAYHKWNLNELVLTQKDNEQEPFIDKIRAEIEKLRPNLRPEQMTDYDYAMVDVVTDIVAILDKYKTEGEKA